MIRTCQRLGLFRLLSAMLPIFLFSTLSLKAETQLSTENIRTAVIPLQRLSDDGQSPYKLILIGTYWEKPSAAQFTINGEQLDIWDPQFKNIEPLFLFAVNKKGVQFVYSFEIGFPYNPRAITKDIINDPRRMMLAKNPELGAGLPYQVLDVQNPERMVRMLRLEQLLSESTSLIPGSVLFKTPRLARLEMRHQEQQTMQHLLEILAGYKNISGLNQELTESQINQVQAAIFTRYPDRIEDVTFPPLKNHPPQELYQAYDQAKKERAAGDREKLFTIEELMAQDGHQLIRLGDKFAIFAANLSSTQAQQDIQDLLTQEQFKDLKRLYPNAPYGALVPIAILRLSDQKWIRPEKSSSKSKETYGQLHDQSELLLRQAVHIADAQKHQRNNKLLNYFKLIRQTAYDLTIIPALSFSASYTERGLVIFANYAEKKLAQFSTRTQSKTLYKILRIFDYNFMNLGELMAVSESGILLVDPQYQTYFYTMMVDYLKPRLKKGRNSTPQSEIDSLVARLSASSANERLEAGRTLFNLFVRTSWNNEYALNSRTPGKYRLATQTYMSRLQNYLTETNPIDCLSEQTCLSRLVQTLQKRDLKN